MLINIFMDGNPHKEISEDKIYICEVNIFLKNAKHSFEKIQKNILHFLLKNIFNFGLLNL